MGRNSEKKRVYGKAARRRQRSRRRYGMYCLLTVLLMLGIGAALSLTVFFNIVSITVEGDSRYTEKEIIAASKIEMGDNLFRLAPSKVERAIVKQFPYIESAAIKRVLPDGVIIKVKEAKCDSVIEWQGEYSLISEKGRILETEVSLLPEGEYRVSGFDMAKLDAGDYLRKADKERYDVLREIKRCIAQSGLEKTDVIALDDLMDIKLLYDGRIIIEMGSDAETEYKIQAAKKVLELSDDMKTVAVLDVSSRPAMRLREMDIYDENVWPFSEELREDYKRVVIKPKPEHFRQSDEIESADAADSPEAAVR